MNIVIFIFLLFVWIVAYILIEYKLFEGNNNLIPVCFYYIIQNNGLIGAKNLYSMRGYLSTNHLVQWIDNFTILSTNFLIYNERITIPKFIWFLRGLSKIMYAKHLPHW